MVYTPGLGSGAFGIESSSLSVATNLSSKVLCSGMQAVKAAGPSPQSVMVHGFESRSLHQF